MQKVIFWLVKGHVLGAKRSPFASQLIIKQLQRHKTSGGNMDEMTGTNGRYGTDKKSKKRPPTTKHLSSTPQKPLGATTPFTSLTPKNDCHHRLPCRLNSAQVTAVAMATLRLSALLPSLKLGMNSVRLTFDITSDDTPLPSLPITMRPQEESCWP